AEPTGARSGPNVPTLKGDVRARRSESLPLLLHRSRAVFRLAPDRAICLQAARDADGAAVYSSALGALPVQSRRPGTDTRGARASRAAAAPDLGGLHSVLGGVFTPHVVLSLAAVYCCVALVAGASECDPDFSRAGVADPGRVYFGAVSHLPISQRAACCTVV